MEEARSGVFSFLISAVAVCLFAGCSFSEPPVAASCVGAGCDELDVVRPEEGTTPEGSVAPEMPTPNPDSQTPIVEDPGEIGTPFTSNEEFDPTTDACGDMRLQSKIYYGTDEPTLVPLTENQKWAIGKISGCSATLITQRWVLTAAHCGVSNSTEFCMGKEPNRRTVCVDSVRGFRHRDYNRSNFWADVALLELVEDASNKMPGVQPIPILTEDIDSSWVGRRAEAAGYGRDENGNSGRREFAELPVVEIRGDNIGIDGERSRGVCFGDSGGPLLALADDGTVRVAGALSHIRGSCMNDGFFKRVDTYRDWIEGYTGPTIVDGAPCGDQYDSLGRCLEGRAMWCGEEDTLEVERCDEGSTCGWDESRGGYRCISGPDPCDGLDGFGVCEGNVAKWCERGTLKTRSCGDCGESCTESDHGFLGIYCAPDPCAGLDYFGRCAGGVVEYCKDGEFKSRDCTAEGLQCNWVNDDLGYWCS